MAVILPFRGLRYNTTEALDLSMVTAPPYDVISPAMQDDLLDAHPYNIVRLILNRETPEDNGRNNRYTRSAALLNEWIREGVLVRERKPALYLYEQEFTALGRTTMRRGFIGRVALEEFGEGCIYPHEHTLPKPKADRLELLKATRCNLSQILALYPDERNEVMAVFDQFPLAKPDLLAVDDAGIVNRVWIITDETAVAEIGELMSERPLYIADGHHRYTTALNYRRHLREQGENVSEHHPANYTSITCVSMSDAGLVVLPTHRILGRMPEVSADKLRDILKPHFSWKSFIGAEATSGRMEGHLGNGHVAFGFYLRGDQAGYIATLKDNSIMARLAPEHSDAWRHLDVAVLHRLVINHLLAEALGNPETFDIRYTPRAAEAFDAVHENGAAMAVLVRPTRVEQMATIAGNGELMPEKSTYFYPKLTSGLVMNPLD